MRKPMTIDMSRPRSAIGEFKVDDNVCFVRNVDRHDQVEHPDPLPVINTGSRGVILENDDKSVLVGVKQGQDGKVIRTVRLYDADPENDDCPLSAIEHLQYRPTKFHCGILPPETTTFSGDPDPYLESGSVTRSRRLEDVWPRESIADVPQDKE